MLDFVVYIKETPQGKWPVPDQESRSALTRWALGQAEGDMFFFRILKQMTGRSKQQHGLYRLRNSILAPALDTDADSLHIHIKSELNLTEDVTIAGKTHTRIRSQKEFTTEELSAMILKQDELAAFANLGREYGELLILPSGDIHERTP